MPTAKVPITNATMRPRDTCSADWPAASARVARPVLDLRPDQDEDQRTDQQHRHDFGEDLLGQMQKQPRAHQGADEGRRHLPAQPVPLAA